MKNTVMLGLNSFFLASKFLLKGVFHQKIKVLSRVSLEVSFNLFYSLVFFFNRQVSKKRKFEGATQFHGKNVTILRIGLIWLICMKSYTLV